MKNVFALIDCENFYVSCERAFNPALRDVPVAILSNNDGRIIARSEELKAEDIPMGAPFFKWEEELEALGAEVLSSNYTLYGDMSRRVHSILEEDALELERYSIDEAFLTLPDLKRENLQRLADRIRRKILKQVGVPIRVGIGPTKTLAKVADLNAKARKRADWGQGTYVCPSEPELGELLECVPVGEIWGIGSAYEKKLHEKGVVSAAEFQALPDPWIRSEMTVVGSHKKVEVEQNREPITIEHVTYEHLWSAIIDQVEARPNKTHFISLYDKGTALDNLTALLNKRGFDTDGVTHFNADTKDGKKQKELMEKNATRGRTRKLSSPRMFRATRSTSRTIWSTLHLCSQSACIQRNTLLRLPSVSGTRLIFPSTSTTIFPGQDPCPSRTGIGSLRSSARRPRPIFVISGRP